MEVVMLTQDINSLFACLGCPIGNDYIVGDDCKATLEKILSRLYKEDKYVRGFRRLIANSQVLKKDLLPLFYNVKNDHKVLDLIIEILENLMIPVECLFPIDIMIKEDAGRSTICQLNWLLTACKEAFLNPSATKSVIDYIKLIMKKEQQVTAEGCHSINLCLQLLRNLLHIPEVRGGAPGGGASHHSKIIWNLFTQHFDKVLIQMIACSSFAMCSLTMVQLISLLFKDQPSNNMHRLLNIWCDSALTESSEDDESNTSPQDQGSADSSSMATSDPTSDSSDSEHQKQTQKKESVTKHKPYPKQAAQNRMKEMLAHGQVGRKAQVAMRNKHGICKNNHPIKHSHRQLDHSHSTDHTHPPLKGTRMCWSSESGLGSNGSASGSLKMECGSPEGSDCGYLTQNPDTISTSSNEDKEPARFGKKKPVHQKSLHMIQNIRFSNGKLPLSSQARKDHRRQKLMKRSKTTMMIIKTFLNHPPSEEDISQLLREFTVYFLLKGFGPLVTEVKQVVLSSRQVHMDTSHFTWLIMYFLRFATELELDLNLISPILSYDIISYLTYEGVNLCEELEVAKLQVGESLSRTLGKLYLIVSSLKEIVFAIENYKKVNHLTDADRDYLRQLQEKISSTSDLKYLFLLLLRHFDPEIQSHQFLQEVVVANHNLMLLIENCPTTKATIADHIKQFATEDVMKQYGVLLACYEVNGEMVNDCIFTMMHHVAGDLDNVSILFQPTILKTFTKILESEFEIRDDWSDLLGYVIQKCLRAKQTKVVPTTHPQVGNHEPTKPSEHHQQTITPPCNKVPTTQWSRDDLDSLCWYYSQSMEMQDPIGHISQLFVENYGEIKIRTEIIENLLEEGLIQEDQYQQLLEKQTSLTKPETIQNVSSDMDILEGIQVIIDYLHDENCGFFVKWLQNCLLETCYARLVIEEDQVPKYDLLEPVAYFYTLLRQPVPLVTWTHELWKVMQREPCIWLLSALNFHLPTRTGDARIFARIPTDWTADHLYVAALILGPIDSSNMKFDPSFLQVIKQTSQSPMPSEQSSTDKTSLQSNSSLFGFFLGSSSTADWIQKVKQLKSFPKVQPLEDKHDRMSVISGDERDWDLISICVSDEGARNEDTTLTHSLS